HKFVVRFFEASPPHRRNIRPCTTTSSSPSKPLPSPNLMAPAGSPLEQESRMRRCLVAAKLSALMFLSAWLVSPATALAQSPDLEARVKDLEAYINNAAPPSVNLVVGPGHNAWLMVCAA